jgi:hypothetical protein
MWEVGSGKCEAHGNLHVKGTESLHKYRGWKAWAVTCVHSYYFKGQVDACYVRAWHVSARCCR